MKREIFFKLFHFFPAILAFFVLNDVNGGPGGESSSSTWERVERNSSSIRAVSSSVSVSTSVSGASSSKLASGISGRTSRALSSAGGISSTALGSSVARDSKKFSSWCGNEDTLPYRFPLLRMPLICSLGENISDCRVRIKKRGERYIQNCPFRLETKSRTSRGYRRDKFIRGVSLGMYFKDEDEGDYDQFLVDIKCLGANYVGFVISWYQRDVSSTEIRRHPKKSMSDARIIQTILQARMRGLEVFLLPIVRLEERGPDDWRGVIEPRDLDSWWRSYRNYILHYAQLGERFGVSLLSVGSELVSMEKYRDRWVELIGAVREVFSGKLVYSANWDHYEPVTFWDKLDYIGISNYFELSKKNEPPADELYRKWLEIRKQIENWKKSYPSQKLLFTEVGYYSQKGTNIYPWDYTREQPLSLEEQSRCYWAFIKTWRESPVLGGTFFWNWFGLGGKKDTGYTPRGKPAECILKQWYSSFD